MSNHVKPWIWLFFSTSVSGCTGDVVEPGQAPGANLRPVASPSLTEPSACAGWSESTVANEVNASPGVGTHISAICAEGTAMWGKGAVIPVCWESPVPNWDYALMVRDAVRDTWEANSAVRFTGWDNCTPKAPGIHILVADVNPASMLGKSALDGRDATLRDDPAGGPLQVLASGMVLNFDFVQWPVPETDKKPKAWWIKLIAIHEFGHALGFHHEQTKGNTPAWCTERDESDAGVACDAYLETRWDPNSVMNYCSPHYTNDGRLSDTDIRALQNYYGSPSECGTPGLTRCDGVCVDLGTEAFHCGACGNACPEGQICQDGGVCGCATGFVLCQGKCVRLGTHDHCSKCGDRCGLGSQCDARRCEDCDPCGCPDGFEAGPDACGGSTLCRKICMAHESGSGHVH